MRSKQLRTGVLFLSILIVAYVVAGGVLGRTAGDSAYKPLAVYSEALSRIHSEYVEKPNMHRVTIGALHGLVSHLDPFSAYLSPLEYKEFQEREKQEGDVGLVLTRRMGWISVVTVLPESPARRAGIRTGDIIESISGISTREMSVEQAKLLLSGVVGTTVQLTLVRQQTPQPETVELVRQRLEPAPPLADTLEGDVAYLKLASFRPGTADRVRALLEEFRDKGADKLVLDVRDAATGEIGEAITTAALLLEDGVVTYAEGQQEPTRQWTADEAPQVWTGALSVLINHGTAGPAEVLAAAVLDHDRGAVVGQPSQGVGSIQKVIPLEDGSALILTVAKYHSPAGRAIPDEGVKPTVEAAPPEGQRLHPVPHARPAPDDPVLRKALETLRQAEPADQAA